jgi:hypothetical protein
VRVTLFDLQWMVYGCTVNCVIVSLTARERVLLWDFISTQFSAANALTWSSIIDAKNILALKESDHEKYGVQIQGTNILFKNIDLANRKEEYDIPERVFLMMQDELKKKSDASQLTENAFSLFAAFFPSPP